MERGPEWEWGVDAGVRVGVGRACAYAYVHVGVGHMCACVYMHV